MPKVESKLKYGRVPAKTPCPFSSVCHEKKAGWCEHQGEAHLVAFSCGVARAFDACLIKIKKSA